MDAIEQFQQEIDAKEGSFLLQLRCHVHWDWAAFHRLTAAMYALADKAQYQDQVDKWIAQGFWFIDTALADMSQHIQGQAGLADQARFKDALELIHDLCSFYFLGESPFQDDSLRQLANDQYDS